MNFEYYNPNPNAKVFKSGKPKSWNVSDDAVRAISKALDKTWIESYEMLDEIAKNSFTIIQDKNVVNGLLCNKEFEYVTLGKPKQGEKRPVVSEFVNMYNKGTYVLYLRDYYITIIDGVVYDTDMNIGNEAVYSYWKK